MNSEQHIKKFFWWIQERHEIFQARQAGKPPPWTKDPVLQKYKFTNPFRQNDRVTRELAVRIQQAGKISDVQLFWLIVLFRMFNHPPTFDALIKYFQKQEWPKAEIKKLLHKRASEGNQIFTGAYIITNNGSTKPKIDLMVDALDAIFRERWVLVEQIKRANSLETAVRLLSEMPMIGKFVGYEIATDLRHTKILGKATDIMTWANPGPGARRGCNRIFSKHNKFNDNNRSYDLPFSMTKEQRLMHEMRTLLKMSVLHLPKSFPKLEMRDIEHSLCEFDKYMRVAHDKGGKRPRSVFKPTPGRLP